MSRETYFDAILQAVRALAPSLGVPVDHVAEWDGEDPTFNPEAAHPALLVAYSGSEPDTDPDGMRMAQYERRHVFSVFVCTATDEYGEAGALARRILDGLEQGLQGPLPGTDRVVTRWGRDELVSVHLGRCTYGMRFVVRDTFTKTF